MRPVDLKDKITQQLSTQLTPRRKRYGLIFLLLFTVYSVLGLLALPGVIISQAQKFVQEKLQLQLSIGKLEFNPWLLAVRIDDVAIKEPGAAGDILLSARSIYVNAQLWSSLWIRGASLDELDLLQPYINTHLRKDGSLNLLQLLPPEDPEDSGEANWRIGQLAIRQGRISVRDDTRPTPFSTLLSPLNLALADLSSQPDKDGGYSLHAETGEGEKLDWRGTLALQPLRSQGELRISDLNATTPWRYLQDELPVIVHKGKISISGKYMLSMDKEPTFSLQQGQVRVDDLSLQQRGPHPLTMSLSRLQLIGMQLQWPEQNAGFDRLELHGFELGDKNNRDKYLDFHTLSLDKGRYQAAGKQNFRLAQIAMKNLRLHDQEEHPALLDLPALILQSMSIDLQKHSAHVDRIILEKGDLSLRREANGSDNWQNRLLPLSVRLAHNPLPASRTETVPAKTRAEKARTASPATKTSTGPAPAWQATLGELDLLGFRAAIEDLVPPGGFRSSLENITLHIFPRQTGAVAHAMDGKLDISSGGTLQFKGQFAEQPLTAQIDLQLQDLKLPPFAPYFADMARFALESGNLYVAGKFKAKQDKNLQAEFDGHVAMQKFAANDLDQDQRFLAWNNLAMNGIHWQLQPGRLSIEDIRADQPFIRVIIDQDKSLNLNRILIAEKTADPSAASTASPAATEPAQAQAKASPAYPLHIKRIRLNNGAMLFADFTLTPQFATGIQSLNGEVKGISTAQKARARVDLKGRVDQYGKADIHGVISPLSSDLYTDMKVDFDNLELTTLTPYSAKFAGYRIDKGKLSMNLNYKIENRALNASNKVVLNQLTLGEKVESQDATKLPVKLAIAILKDKNGVIDLDVPVTGSLDDPRFRVAPLIWKAFVNLLTKAATAPFSLIAGMVGGGDNLDSLAFTTGSSTLAETESQKLDKLAQALSERPALGVEIRGAYDPLADALAIRTAKFDAVYLPRLADKGNARKVLEAMYKEKLGGEALAQQKALSLKPAAAGDNQTELQLAEENYIKVLRNELIARETVLEGDLRALALQRADQVRHHLVEVAKVDAVRVFVLEPVVVSATDNQLTMKVMLTAR